MASWCGAGWLAVLMGLAIFGGSAVTGTAATKPAIVLTAFGTSTAAADTYKYFEGKVKERFPGHEIRWAFTSQNLRQKLREQQVHLPDLPQTIKELKAAGFKRLAIQSLLVVPGEEWEEMVKAAQSQPGLKVAVGEPLLASPEDSQRVLQVLAKEFPPDLYKTAVVLVGHGSPHPEGEAAYLAFEKILRSRYPHQNVFLGVITGKPERSTVFTAVKKSTAETVIFWPFLFVAGEHVNQDVLGDDPKSWKSELLAAKPYRIEGLRRGLGYQQGIIDIYLDHLQGALQELEDRQ